MDIRHYLEKFERKKSPNRIVLNYDVAINYDAYSVYIKHPGNGKEYLFASYENDWIKALLWNEKEKIFNIKEELNPNELNSDSFSGVYYYKAHELRFFSLKDLSWWNETKYKVWANKDNWISSREKYRYRKQRKEIKNLHDVLSVVIGLHVAQAGNRGVHLVNVMTGVFGKLWFCHDDKDQMKKKLLLTLDAFVNNGELIKNADGTYAVNGKALMTLHKYNEEEQRYVESTNIQKRMFWATVFSFFAALASAVAAFKALK